MILCILPPVQSYGECDNGKINMKVVTGPKIRLQWMDCVLLRKVYR